MNESFFSESQQEFLNSGHCRDDRMRILLAHMNLMAKLYEVEENPKRMLLYEKAWSLGYNNWDGLSGIQPYYATLVDLIK